MNLRVARSWAFGRKGESGPANLGHPGGPGGPGGFGAESGLKYNVTLSVNASNAINHVNYATPSGDLSSPYFGEYRALASGFGPNTSGSSTDYNRKITLQLRFTF